MKQMNIVLIGYRGTGKTTIGTRLADRLGWSLVSTDSLIVSRAGASIPEIVEKNGWDCFRDLEAGIVEEVSTGDRQVLDCGGGAVLSSRNRESLRRNGLVVWLRASVEEIAGRIGNDTQRPSLTGERSFVEEIGEVLREREPVYSEAANLEIDTEGRTPDEIASEILTHLPENIGPQEE